MMGKERKAFIVRADKELVNEVDRIFRINGHKTRNDLIVCLLCDFVDKHTLRFPAKRLSRVRSIESENSTVHFQSIGPQESVTLCGMYFFSEDKKEQRYSFTNSPLNCHRCLEIVDQIRGATNDDPVLS